MANSTFLIFDVALNGYQKLYQTHLASHQRYAERVGATYISVTKPYLSLLGVECCWLKLCLMLHALKSGYEHVLFLDADAHVNEHCPDIRETLTTDACLYMANGYSKRFNSGVMLTQNCHEIQRFLAQAIATRQQPIPLEDSVGWGENGHLIHLAKQVDFIATLDHKWNNTYDNQYQDYIRHFNYGPMRQKMGKNVVHKILAATSRTVNKLFKQALADDYTQWQQQLLQHETQAVLAHYPNFSRRKHQSDTDQAHNTRPMHSTSRKAW